MKALSDDENADAQQRFWDGCAEAYQCAAAISLNDFHYGPLLPGEAALQLFSATIRPGVPAPGTGVRGATESAGRARQPGTALELGCGGAQNSLWLAAQGWHCTAVDVSAGQLQQAAILADGRGIPLAEPPSPFAERPSATPDSESPSHRGSLMLVRMPLETLDLKRLGGSFDLIHSVHALQFLQDPFRLLGRVRRCLKPDGLLVLAVQHPLFAGEWLELIEDGFGLFLSNYFRPPADFRDAPDGTRIASRSWPISRWFQALRSFDLTVESLLEPCALPRARLAEAPYPGGTSWQALHSQLCRIPSTLILVARANGNVAHVGPRSATKA